METGCTCRTQNHTQKEKIASAPGEDLPHAARYKIQGTLWLKDYILSQLFRLYVGYRFVHAIAMLWQWSLSVQSAAHTTPTYVAHHGRSLLIKRTVLKILRNLSSVDLDLKSHKGYTWRGGVGEKCSDGNEEGWTKHSPENKMKQMIWEPVSVTTTSTELLHYRLYILQCMNHESGLVTHAPVSNTTTDSTVQLL